MIGYLCKSIFLIVGLVNGSWALPWFQHSIDSDRQSKHGRNLHQNPINFSGDWIGECNGHPAVDLTIKHDNNQLLLSYGFMKERYILGEVKTETSNRLSISEYTSTLANWNPDQTALIFIHYNLFTNATGLETIFFSKVSMFLEGTQLVVKGQHYQTYGAVSDVEHETMLCTYQQK